MWVQLSTTCSNYWSSPMGTVDPIEWLHPPPYTGQYTLSSTSTYCTLQCGLGCKSQDSLHWDSLEPATFRMPDQRTAGAATQGSCTGSAATLHRQCRIAAPPADAYVFASVCYSYELSNIANIVLMICTCWDLEQLYYLCYILKAYDFK